MMMIKKCLFLYFLIGSFSAVSAQNNGFYNVRDFGAKGDGMKVDGPAINRAIEQAFAEGGGTVIFPAGQYLSGSVRLKSNIHLQLNSGAQLIAAGKEDGAEYDKPELSENDRYQDFGHSHFHNSLIWGEDLVNVSITGPGRIYGKGLSRGNSTGDTTPNKSISLKRCRNVLIRDIVIYHGGWFGILATGVDHLTIDNVTMDTNRDGMDIDCCHYVNIANCRINTPLDDGICLKSSYALNTLRATENVTITNCIVSGYDEGTVLDGSYKRTPPSDKFDRGPFGRIKFGTESNGGFKNITISNCVFDYCRGLAIETTDGGKIEDVSITNITMRDIVNSPIYVRIGTRMRAPENTLAGQARRINIGNILIYDADPRQASIISGVRGANIQDISLHDIQVYTKGGGTLQQAKRKMPEVEKEFPEPERHGITPAYGFYVRHVKGIAFSNIKVRSLTADYRPAFFLDDVDGAKLQQLDLVRTKRFPLIMLNQVANFRMGNNDNLKNIELKNSTLKEISY